MVVIDIVVPLVVWLVLHCRSRMILELKRRSEHLLAAHETLEGQTFELAAMTAELESQRHEMANALAAGRAASHEASFQKLTMDQHAIVAMTDASGRLEYVNGKFCQISGYSADELIGRDHRVVNSDRHPKSFYGRLYATISAGMTWRGEICNRTKGGQLYWVDTTIVPFRDEHGQITRYVAVSTDITQLKQIEAELTHATRSAQAASAAKGEFLANMSHEIRTPMTAIVGYADLLADESLDLGRRREFVKVIRNNAAHLLTIINDILDLSKIESGKLQVERIAFKPCDVLADVALLMQVRAAAKRVSLVVDFEPPIPETIQSDPTRVRQVLLNLVGNAIKFTDAGAIRVVCSCTRERTPKLVFDVIDTGVGMPPDVAERLFQPFSQADESTTRRFGGTGLGLSISQRLCTMLGGQVEVVRTAPDAGSHFRATIAAGSLEGVRLLEKDQLSLSLRCDGAAPPPPNHLLLTGARILLVEDGPDNQRLVSFMLKKAGATVQTAENGRVGIDAVLTADAAHEPFDLILMDMQMPELDGYAATRELRNRGYRIPIVAMTAHAMAGDREKCLDAGCDDYVSKPIDKRRLFEVLNTYLAPSRRHPAVPTESAPLEGSADLHTVIAGAAGA